MICSASFSFLSAVSSPAHFSACPETLQFRVPAEMYFAGRRGSDRGDAVREQRHDSN